VFLSEPEECLFGIGIAETEMSMDLSVTNIAESD
jgi:hypothetical protein